MHSPLNVKFLRITFLLTVMRLPCYLHSSLKCQTSGLIFIKSGVLHNWRPPSNSVFSTNTRSNTECNWYCNWLGNNRSIFVSLPAFLKCKKFVITCKVGMTLKTPFRALKLYIYIYIYIYICMVIDLLCSVLTIRDGRHAKQCQNRCVVFYTTWGVFILYNATSQF